MAFHKLSKNSVKPMIYIDIALILLNVLWDLYTALGMHNVLWGMYGAWKLANLVLGFYGTAKEHACILKVFAINSVILLVLTAAASVVIGVMLTSMFLYSSVILLCGFCAFIITIQVLALVFSFWLVKLIERDGIVGVVYSTIGQFPNASLPCGPPRSPYQKRTEAEAESFL